MSQERVTGRVIDRSFDVGPVAELHVNNVRGLVRVTGADVTTIHAHVEVDPERRLSDADLDRGPIEIVHEGNRVSLKLVMEKNVMDWLGRMFGPPEVRFVVQVPTRTQTNVSCLSADVYLAGLAAAQSVNTVSGKVMATDVVGDVRVNTLSGGAAVTHVQGAVRWNTVSGDLIVRESKVSELRGNSVSGSSEVQSTSGLAGGAHVQTVSGDLRLTVPAGFGFEAQLSSMSGSARCDLPAQVHENRRGKWRATINGGGPTVRLGSVSGSLRLLAQNGAVRIPVEPQQPPAPSPDAPSQSVVTPQASDRRAILERVERGEISIDEGLAQLDALRQRGTAAEGDR